MQNTKKTQNKITINDVAMKSGVSKTTVSRYINGHYDMMSEEVGFRIQSVIDELGFRPSRIAQNLKSKHTAILGCVIADISSPFAASLVEGISDICTQNDYQVLFVNTGNNPKREREAIRSLLDSKVDGLIVNTAGHNEEYLHQVRNTGVPIVIADRYLNGDTLIDTISSTNYQSTFECIEYLYEQGYDHVYFFGQALGNNRARVIRHQAFLDAHNKYFDTEASHTYFITDHLSDAQVLKGLTELNDRAKKGENIAIFAVNGMMMLDLLVAMKKLNITVGDDLGLCGFDDWTWADLIGPGITTIRQDTYQLGARSTRRLLQLIQSDAHVKPKLVELPTQLMKRGSTEIKK
jgi:LacI family transcriptional regulator, kdg operon repressor